MPKLYIVCGLSGAGKTTVSKHLSKKFKVPCIHKDTIKEVLYERLGLSSLEDSKKIGWPSVALMLAIAEENLKNGISIMIESPFNQENDYKIFRSWINKYGIDIVSIVCEIDEFNRLDRIKNRKSRHKAHHDLERTFEESSIEEINVYNKIPGNKIFFKNDSSLEIFTENVKKYFI